MLSANAQSLSVVSTEGKMGTCTYRWKERLKYFEAGWFERGGALVNHKHLGDNDTDSGIRYPPPV